MLIITDMQKIIRNLEYKIFCKIYNQIRNTSTIKTFLINTYSIKTNAIFLNCGSLVLNS